MPCNKPINSTNEFSNKHTHKGISPGWNKCMCMYMFLGCNPRAAAKLSVVLGSYLRGDPVEATVCTNRADEHFLRHVQVRLDLLEDGWVVVDWPTTFDRLSTHDAHITSRRGGEDLVARYSQPSYEDEVGLRDTLCRVGRHQGNRPSHLCVWIPARTSRLMLAELPRDR